jgi:hypothetical protein
MSSNTITTSGSNVTTIGYNSQPSSSTASNEITLGDTNVNRFRIPGAGIDNTSAALTGTTPSINVSARDTYTHTLTGNTTYSFTNIPPSGIVGTVSLIITQSSSTAYTLTWPASVKWSGGTQPDDPEISDIDMYSFMTVDGGTTWYGFLSGDAMS